MITRLREAGSIFLGQLNTYEFTFGGRPTFDALYPPARNPWNIDRSTGGSSSGSGAAVAAGFCLGALGSDAGGSIRTPSAFCGIAGMKPTFGRVSAFGDLPLSFSFDCVGPMTWTSEDSALMLQVLAGYDERDAGSVDIPVADYVGPLDKGIQGLKIGFIRHFFTTDFAAPPVITQAIDTMSTTLEDMGAIVDEVQVSPLIDWHAVGRIILPAEAYAIHKDRLEAGLGDQYDPLVAFRLQSGKNILASDYINMLHERKQVWQAVQARLQGFDALVLPTAPILPPLLSSLQDIESKIQQSALSLRNTALSNYLDRPTISMPCHSLGTGPVGLSLIGSRQHDRRLLAIAAACETIISPS